METVSLFGNKSVLCSAVWTLSVQIVSPNSLNCILVYFSRRGRAIARIIIIADAIGAPLIRCIFLLSRFLATDAVGEKPCVCTAPRKIICFLSFDWRSEAGVGRIWKGEAVLVVGGWARRRSRRATLSHRGCTDARVIATGRDNGNSFSRHSATPVYWSTDGCVILRRRRRRHRRLLPFDAWYTDWRRWAATDPRRPTEKPHGNPRFQESHSSPQCSSSA